MSDAYIFPHFGSGPLKFCTYALNIKTSMKICPNVLRHCSDWTLGTKQILGHKLPLAYKSPWYMTRLTRISTLHHTFVSLFRGGLLAL